MQDKKQSLVPELRFPGFEGEWEETILSDILRERNEQYPENEDYPLMAFVANVGVCPKGDRYDRGALVKDAKSKKYKRTKLGDFIYSSNNLETGSIGQNHFGNACISPVYSIFEINDKYDNFFIGTLLTKKEFISKMVQYRQGVIYGQWKIHETEFLKLTVSVPSLPEQQKIAECLSSVDDLIQAEADQLQALKDHKKGLIQQLFPQEGETTPKLRFPGFKGEWEEKKLGEIGIFSKGKGISKAETNPNGVTPCIRYGELYTKYGEQIYEVFSMTNLPLEQLVLSETNDVIIPASGETHEDIATASCILKSGIAIGGDINIIKTSLNGTFLSFFLNSALKHQIARIAQGDAVVHLYGEQLKKLYVKFPSLPEQQKIASCLSSLDEGIAAQQRKVEALKEHKKGLMQKLFPTIN